MKKADWKKFKKSQRDFRRSEQKFKIKLFLYKITRPFKKHDDYYILCPECEHEFTIPWKDRDLGSLCPKCGCIALKNIS